MLGLGLGYLGKDKSPTFWVAETPSTTSITLLFLFLACILFLANKDAFHATYEEQGVVNPWGFQGGPSFHQPSPQPECGHFCNPNRVFVLTCLPEGRIAAESRASLRSPTTMPQARRHALLTVLRAVRANTWPQLGDHTTKH